MPHREFKPVVAAAHTRSTTRALAPTDNSVTVRFRGVRGSIAVPGDHTRRVGGNTPCIEFVHGGTRIVLDAGTGIRSLGDELISAGPCDLTLLLSHLHWDHIQGLPFFTPLYVPGNRIEVLSGPSSHGVGLATALRKQMMPPFFPVEYDRVASQLRLRDLPADATVEIGDVRVTMARLNHPDPVYGFRLEASGFTVVYATDTEHYACVDPTLRRLARDADVLIYDAQYTPEEYCGAVGPSRVGWGHSTFAAGIDLARAAGVDKLVLFHHDPNRSDDEVDRLEARARRDHDNTIAAREGTLLRLARIELPKAAGAS